MVLSSAGDTEEYETDNEPKVINIQEETVVTLTCESMGSLPSAALSWALGNKSISENISSSVHRNVLDGSLYDTKSTIKIHPTRMVHGKLLKCFISLGSFNGRREAILMVYGEFKNLLHFWSLKIQCSRERPNRPIVTLCIFHHVVII